MQYKVSELEGPLLDVAVAMAEGYKWRIGKWDYGARDVCYAIGQPTDSDIYSPSEGWEDGGPIIERERIELQNHAASDGWWAGIRQPTDQSKAGGTASTGPTPLVAAMRAYVSSKYGEFVEIQQ